MGQIKGFLGVATGETRQLPKPREWDFIDIVNDQSGREPAQHPWAVEVSPERLTKKKSHRHVESEKKTIPNSCDVMHNGILESCHGLNNVLDPGQFLFLVQPRDHRSFLFLFFFFFEPNFLVWAKKKIDRKKEKEKENENDQKKKQKNKRNFKSAGAGNCGGPRSGWRVV
jgi:hypothetical protein